MRVLIPLLACTLWMPFLMGGGGLQANSLSEEDYFAHLGIEEGLTGSAVTCMLQDAKGYLWIGTQDGLNRWDGYQVKAYRHKSFDPTTLSGNFISSLVEDKQGQLWVGTTGGGLSRLNPDTGEFIHCCWQFSTRRTNPEHAWVKEIVIQENILWYAHAEGLTEVTLDETGLPISQRDLPPSESGDSLKAIEQIRLDADGQLWVGTQTGLFRQKPGSQEFYRVGGTSGQVGWVRDFVFDSSGAPIVLGEDHRLYRYQKRSDAFALWELDVYQPEDGRITTLMVDQENRLWVGTLNNGFHILDEQGGHLRFSPQPRRRGSFWSEEVTQLLEGKQGLVWVGTHHGVYIWSPARNKFRNYSTFSSQATARPSAVWGLLLDRQDQLWVGTSSNGLACLDRKTGQVAWLDQPPTGQGAQPMLPVYSLLEDSKGNIWAGGVSGLVKRDPKTGRKRHYGKEEGLPDDFVRDILEDRWGRIWLLTNQGLACLDPETDAIETYHHDPQNSSSLFNNRIITGYIDQEDRLWLGSFLGLSLAQLDASGASFPGVEYHYVPEDESHSLSSSIIASIYQDSKGEMWIGTPSGLNQLDPATGTVKHFGLKEGLQSLPVYGIMEDEEERLWLSHAGGLSCMDPARETIRFYTHRDGLQAGEFNMGSVFATQEGEFFAGGAQGVNSFFPASMYADEPATIPKLALLEVLSGPHPGRRPIKVGDTLTLAWNENNIRVDLQVLNHLLPEENRGQYRLQGMDEEWITIGGQDNIRLAALAPADYCLEVRGINAGGQVSEETGRLVIIIASPFWQQAWFMVLVMMLSFALLWGLLALNHAQRRRRQRRLNAAVRRENERLQKATARDFHDEMGHYITRIILLSGLMVRSDSPDQQSNLSTTIQENCEHLARGTRDFIWSIDPSQASLYDLAFRVREFGEGLFEYSEVAFRVNGLHTNMDAVQLPMDLRRHLAMILKEALHNVIRHAKARNVSLDFDWTPERLQILIQDDGVLRGALPQSSGNGLQNMRTRAAKIGAQLKFQIDQGLLVSLCLQVPTSTSMPSS